MTCRYRVAAAFFLLANPPSLKSAVETIVAQTQDVDLAFFIMRLMTSQELEKKTASGAEIGSSGFGGIFGGGGGYSAVGAHEATSASDENSLFAEWRPDLAMTPL